MYINYYSIIFFCCSSFVIFVLMDPQEQKAVQKYSLDDQLVEDAEKTQLVNLTDKFNTLTYLSLGNARQRAVYSLLTDHKIFEQLADFDPVLAGTIPIDIDIKSSDLDIICYYTDAAVFLKHLQDNFSKFDHFQSRHHHINGQERIVVNFQIDNWPIEIFGQTIPSKSQAAYRHMIVEHLLLLKHGKGFRKQVIDLKNEGIKTEPAFAKLLGLSGDPYAALLKLYPL